MADKSDKIDLSGVDDVYDKHDLSSMPPAPEDLNETSTLGAAGLGAVKGATFGFDDEIAGLAKALVDKGYGSKKDFWDIYKEVRDSVRKEHDLAEEQHPVASFAGELAGGIVPMAAAPALGAGALIGEAAPEGATFLQKAKAMASMGAKAGAIAGLGNSKADLTQGQVIPAAQDVASSTILGAGAGVGLQALGSTANGLASGAANVVKNLPYAQDLGQVFTDTAQGNDLLGQIPAKAKDISDLANQFGEELDSQRALAGANKTAASQQLSNLGVKVPIEDIVDKALDNVNNTKTYGTKQKGDIEEINNVLKDLLGQKEEETSSFIPKSKLPQPSYADKTAKAIAAKTAEAQTSDDMQLASMLQKVDEEQDPEVRDRLLKKIYQLQDATEYPPTTSNDPLTSMDVMGVDRGAFKKPIVKAIPTAEESTFTPIQKITNTQTVRGDTNLSPTDLDNVLKSLSDAYDNMDTGLGRRTLKDVRDQVKSRLEDVLNDKAVTKEDAIDDFTKAINSYEGNNETFKDIAATQEALGLPSYGGGEPSTNAKLQALIRAYDKPGSTARVALDNALDKLAQGHPELANQYRQMIAKTSNDFRLANQLTGESFMTGSHSTLGTSTKATGLLAARAAGKGAEVANNTAKSIIEPAKDISSKMVNIGKQIYDYSPDQIQDMADYAIKKGGNYASNIGSVLSQVVNAPMAKRRAVLFSLMQQPDFRSLANDYQGGDDVGQ